MPNEKAAKLAATIAARHQEEIRCLAEASGISQAALETLGPVLYFTMGRMMGMVQTLHVLKETGE